MVNFGNAPNNADNIQDLWYALSEAGFTDSIGENPSVSIDDSDGSLTIDTDDGPIEVDSVPEFEEDTTNSTTTPLDAGEEFVGEWKQWNDAAGLDIVVLSDVLGGENDDGFDALTVEFSYDGGNTVDDQVDIDYPPRESLNEPKDAIDVHISRIAGWYRVRYQNGSTAQSNFHLHTTRLPIPVQSKVLPIEDNVDSRSSAELVKSVITARDPDGDYINLTSNRKGDLKTEVDQVGNNAYRYAPRGDVTLYGSQVTASKVPQIERQFHEDDPNEELDITTTGAAAATQEVGHARFSSSTDTSASLTAETFQKIQYLTSAEIMVSFAVAHIQPPTSAGDYSMIGLSDGNNGFEVGYKGTQFGVRRLRGGSEENFVPKSEFNIDKLDGNPESEYQRNDEAVPIDHTTQDMWRIRYGWYGVAPTHIEVLAPDGHWVSAHKFDYTTEDIPQTNQPDLPIRTYIEKFNSDDTDIRQNINAMYGGVMANVSIAQQPDGDYVAEKASGQSTITEELLTANETYTSPWRDSDGWGSIEIQINSDQPSADKGIVVQYTSKANVPNPPIDSEKKLTLTQEQVNTDTALRAILPTQLDGYRLKYINGPTGQNRFKAVTTLLKDLQTEATTLASPIDNETLATTARSIPQAEDDSGNIDNITRNGEGLRTSVNSHETDTPIRPLSNFETTQRSVPDLDGGGPVEVLVNPLTDRKVVAIKNDGSKPVYLGSDEFVRDTNGFPINVGETGHFELDGVSELWMIAADSTGGTTTHRLSPTAGSTSGSATSPDNVVSSDDTWAIYDTVDEFVDAAGYDASAVQVRDNVTEVDIGFEGSKDDVPGTQTVNHEETQVGKQTGGTSITTDNPVVANSNHYYTAFIAVRDEAESVLSVDGMDLSWSRKTTGTNSNGVKMEIWSANGTDTITSGTVTANFDDEFDAAIIAVNRWSGVSNSSPIVTTVSNTGNTAAWDATLNDTAISGRTIGASAIVSETTNDPGTDDTEHSETSISGSNAERLTLATQSRSSSGSSETVDGTWAVSDPWVTLGVSLNPEALVDPKMLVEYEVGTEGTGETTGTFTIDNATDESYLLDVTADRDWTYTDIDNTTATVTLDNDNTENAEIDHIFIEFVEADAGSTQRVGFTELA